MGREFKGFRCPACEHRPMEMIARVSFRAPSRLYARIHHKDVLRGADVQFLGVDWDNVTLVCRKCGHPVTPGEFGKPVGRIE